MLTWLSVDATSRKDEIMQRVKSELATAQAQELIGVSRNVQKTCRDSHVELSPEN